MKIRKKEVGLIIYCIALFFPIYWLINCSFKSNAEIFQELTLFPRDLILDNYKAILYSHLWMDPYFNSLIYVCLNVIITLLASIPGAYAFSRWNFLGKNHLFFWLLTNRMAPAAVFMLPFTELYFAIKLFDTHWGVALAHCLFNIPIAVWILEGFMSAIPREIDETAFIDGYSFPRFFYKIFLPLMSSGIGVAAFFVFTFSWIEVVIVKTLTSTDAAPISMKIFLGLQSSEGVSWGILAAITIFTIIPGAVFVYFIRNYIAKGFSLGRV